MKSWRLMQGRTVGTKLGPVIVRAIELVTSHQERIAELAELLLKGDDGDGYFHLGSWELETVTHATMTRGGRK